MTDTYKHKSGTQRVRPVPGGAEQRRLADDPAWQVETAETLVDRPRPAPAPRLDAVVSPPPDGERRTATASGIAKIRTGGAAK